MVQSKVDTQEKNEVVGKTASVNGIELYYEIQGAGRPLVLLHGGVGASEMFAPLLPLLARERQVIAVHLQGHGRTVDIDRLMRFESMADDIAALLKHLNLLSADLLGYSLGGGVALQTTIRHPDLVRKLVLVSTPFKRQGFYPEVLEGMAQLGPEAAQYMRQSPLSRLYPQANWPVLYTKLGDLLRREYDWSKGVTAIKSPMMLVYADADAVRPAHALEFFMLPGMTHYDVLTYPGLADILAAFLDARMPADG
jgi:pimeloyl-ACP methyl ester carboxylesterase